MVESSSESSPAILISEESSSPPVKIETIDQTHEENTYEKTEKLDLETLK